MKILDIQIGSSKTFLEAYGTEIVKEGFDHSNELFTQAKELMGYYIKEHGFFSDCIIRNYVALPSEMNGGTIGVKITFSK